MAGPGFDASEPPDGDFARYLEQISASSAAALETRAAAAVGQRGENAQRNDPAEIVRTGTRPAPAETERARLAREIARARHATTTVDPDSAPATGLDACPGPGAGFGLGSTGRGRSATAWGGSGTGDAAAWGRSGTGDATTGRPAPFPVDLSRRLATASSPVRFVDALTLAMVIGGGALIALALLPGDPWLSTPLPGFLLLVTGLYLRKRFGSRRKTFRTR